MKLLNRPTFAKSPLHRFARLAMFSTSLIAVSVPARAQTTATWSATPSSAEWGHGVGINWVEGVAPMNPEDTAIFGASTVTNITSSSSLYVGSLILNADAPAYTFNVGNDADVSIVGAGIVNNSAYAPEFIVSRNWLSAFSTGLTFGGAAKAANAIIRITDSGHVAFTGNASLDNGSLIISGNGAAAGFYQASTFGTGSVQVATSASLTIAGTVSLGSAHFENDGSVSIDGTANGANATIVNRNGLFFSGESSGGQASISNSRDIEFYDDSSAGQATVTQTDGQLSFYGNSSAGYSQLTLKGGVLTFWEQSVGAFSNIAVETGGRVEFRDNSDAQYALVTVRSGGSVNYFDSASASASNVTVEAGGRFDMSGFTGSELRVASIAGAGEFVLGTAGTGNPTPLIVGGYGADTEVSGTIVNSFAGRAGALVKVGGGTLTLSGAEANTFWGGLTVNRGTVVLAKSPGVVATGTGRVTLEPDGTLRFASNNQLSPDADFTLAGGALQTNGYSATTGTLLLTANSTLDFGSVLASSIISFADSSEAEWTPGATLTVLNYQVGSSNLRFGTNSSGLTSAQLAQLYFSGYGDGLAQIDLNGYVLPVSAIPEPSTYAVLAGIAALGLAVRRRRKIQA